MISLEIVDSLINIKYIIKFFSHSQFFKCYFFYMSLIRGLVNKKSEKKSTDRVKSISSGFVLASKNYFIFFFFYFTTRYSSWFTRWIPGIFHDCPKKKTGFNPHSSFNDWFSHLSTLFFPFHLLQSPISRCDLISTLSDHVIILRDVWYSWCISFKFNLDLPESFVKCPVQYFKFPTYLQKKNKKSIVLSILFYILDGKNKIIINFIDNKKNKVSCINIGHIESSIHI